MAGLPPVSIPVITGITGLPVTSCVKVSNHLYYRSISVVLPLFSPWENEKYTKSTKSYEMASKSISGPTYLSPDVFQASKKSSRV